MTSNACYLYDVLCLVLKVTLRGWMFFAFPLIGHQDTTHGVIKYGAKLFYNYVPIDYSPD